MHITFLGPNPTYDFTLVIFFANFWCILKAKLPIIWHWNYSISFHLVSEFSCGTNIQLILWWIPSSIILYISHFFHRLYSSFGNVMILFYFENGIFTSRFFMYQAFFKCLIFIWWWISSFPTLFALLMSPVFPNFQST